MLKIKPESTRLATATYKRATYFFDMFEDMWGSHGEVLPEDVQYSLCANLKQ